MNRNMNEQLDWYELDDQDEILNAAVSSTIKYKNDLSQLHNKWNFHYLYYLNHLNIASDDPLPTRTGTNLNIVRSVADTAVAAITSNQPAPKLITTNADWKTQRRVRLLERAILANLYLRQDIYSSYWDVCLAAYQDAVITGNGFVHVIPDYIGKKVKYIRVKPENLLVDVDEADKCMNVNTVFIKEEINVKTLKSQLRIDPTFAKKSSKSEKEEILDEISGNDGIVELFHGYYISPNKEESKYILFTDTQVLKICNYPYSNAPIIHLKYETSPRSFFANSILDDVLAVQDDITSIAVRIQAQAFLCSGRRVYVPLEANVRDEDLVANDYEVIVKYQGGQPPIESVTAPFPAELFQYLETLFSRAFELTGLNQASATGQKEAGINSAVAMRTAQAVYSQRLAPKHKDYEEQVAIEGSRYTIVAIKQLLDVYPKLKWNNNRMKSHYQQIEFSDGSLDEEKFIIRIAPVSSVSDSPAGRIQSLQDMAQSQLISPQTFNRIINSTLDNVDVNERSNSLYEYIEDLIEKYMDSTEDDYLSLYSPPESFNSNPSESLWQFTSAYWLAKRSNAPEHVLYLLRTSIVDLDRLITPPDTKQQLDAAKANQIQMNLQ